MIKIDIHHDKEKIFYPQFDYDWRKSKHAFLSEKSEVFNF